MMAEFLKIWPSRLNGIVCISYCGKRFSIPIKTFHGAKREEEDPSKS